MKLDAKARLSAAGPYKQNEQDLMDRNRSAFKREELETELRHEDGYRRPAKEWDPITAWYVLINGKYIKNKQGQYFKAATESACWKIVHSLEKLSWNKGKKIEVTFTRPHDDPPTHGLR